MPEGEVMECPICGAEVGEAAEECPECGEPLVEEDEEKAIERLTEISGLGKSRAKKLYEEGFKTPRAIIEGGMKGLAGIEQIGVRTARKIIDEAEEFIEEEDQPKEEVEKVEETEEETVEELERVEEVEQVEEETGEESVEEVERAEEVEQVEEEEEEEVEELEEGEEEVGEEFVESITKDLKSIVEEEELKEGPQRVIIGEKIWENLGDLIPLVSSLLIPVFLLILVASEYILSILNYASVYPAQSLYYFSPLPYIVSSWIGSLTLSLVIVGGIFITTWMGYDFNSVRQLTIDKNMIFFSAILSVIISISLLIHISSSQMYSGIAFTYFLFVLSVVLLVTQLILLWKKETVFPRIEEKKVCEKCSGLIDLDMEKCPRCSLELPILEERIREEEYEGVWYSTVSFLRNKLPIVSEVSKEETVSEEELLEVEKVPETPPPEKPPEPREVPESPTPEEVPRPEEEEGILESFSGIGKSIRGGLSSTVSFLQNKLGRGSKAETEEIPLEEEREEAIESEAEKPELEEEEEISEPEEEIPEGEIEEELTEFEEELEEEEGILESVSGIGESIKNGLSSTVSYLQNKLRGGPKAETEEIPLEEEEMEEEFEEEEEIEDEGVCPTCGAVIPADSEECPECGEILELSEEEPEEEEKEMDMETSLDELEKVGEDKFEMDMEGSLDELEKALEEVEEETEEVAFVCPICDAELKEDVDECPECGTVFVEEEEEGIVEEALE